MKGELIEDIASSFAAVSLADLQAMAKPETTREELEEQIDNSIKEMHNIVVRGAVVGNSGVGKSTFINTFINKDANTEGAAKVGIKECTADTHHYSHTDNPNIKISDIPGMGTETHPAASYYEDKNLAQFDFIVIVIGNRISENDVNLMNLLVQNKKPHFVVRSRIDVDIESEKSENVQLQNFEDDEYLTAEEQQQKRDLSVKIANETLIKIREYLMDEHNKIVSQGKFKNVAQRVYLVGRQRIAVGSKRVFRLGFEYQELLQDIGKSLTIVQQAALVHTILVVGEAWINIQKSVMKRSIPAYAATSAIAGLSPVIGVSVLADVAIVTKFGATCANVFGLTKEKLSQLVSEQEMNFILCEVADIIARKIAMLTLLGTDDALKAIPIVGQILGMAVGATISGPVMYYILSSTVDQMAEYYRKYVINKCRSIV